MIMPSSEITNEASHASFKKKKKIKECFASSLVKKKNDLRWHTMCYIQLQRWRRQDLRAAALLNKKQ